MKSDDAFHAALKARPREWAIRAIAGYTTREFCKTSEQIAGANRHGLARAHTAEEREAWTFGFTWRDTLAPS